MPDARALYFFDSVVLSNFALSDCIALIVNRYGKRAVLTSEVLDEIAQGIAAGYTPLHAIVDRITNDELGTAVLEKTERLQYTALLKTLGSGEASCIACASTRGGVVVTDDKAARQCAAENGVPVTGTLGILRRLALDDVITVQEADDILSEMIRQGFYSPLQRISDLV